MIHYTQRIQLLKDHMIHYTQRIQLLKDHMIHYTQRIDKDHIRCTELHTIQYNMDTRNASLPKIHPE